MQCIHDYSLKYFRRYTILHSTCVSLHYIHNAFKHSACGRINVDRALMTEAVRHSTTVAHSQKSARRSNTNDRHLPALRSQFK